MKGTVSIGSLLLIILLLCGCKQSKTENILNRIDSLSGKESPELTLRRLDSLRKQGGGFSVRNQMHFDFLEQEAHRRNYEVFTTDTVVRKIADWYMEHGNNREKARAYTLMGSACVDIYNYAEAVDWFSLAIETADTTDVRRKAVSMIHIIDTYDALGLYNKEKQAAFQLLGLKGKQEVTYPEYAFLYLGYANQGLSQIDSALYYYKKSLDILPQDISSEVKVDFSLCYIQALLKTGQFHQANHLLQKIKKYDMSKLDLEDDYYKTAAQYFMKTNQLDSAEAYAKQIFIRKFTWEMPEAYEILSKVMKQKGNLVKSLMYRDSVMFWKEKNDSSHFHSAFVNINMLHNYHKQLNETHQKHRALLTSIVILSIVIIIALTLYLLYYRLKQNKKQLWQRYKDIYSKYCDNKNSLYLINKQMQEYQNEIAELQLQQNTQNAEKLQNIEKYYRDLEKQKQILESLIQELVIPQDYLNYMDIAFHHSETYQQLIRWTKIGQTLDESKWALLEKEICHYYPKFRGNIHTFHPRIHLNEWRVCLLEKCNIKPADMARLINIGRSTVTDIRKRLYLRLTGKAGDGNMFHKFIINL